MDLLKSIYYFPVSGKMAEVQKHGFIWERELLTRIYGATEEELGELSYTEKNDLPRRFNKLDDADVSIKTTCSKNKIDMADILRIYDTVSLGEPFHMTVVIYDQIEETKSISSIVEVDLTNAKDELFGCVLREQIVELIALVKAVPFGQRPEGKIIRESSDYIKSKSGAIIPNVKIDSKKQRRVQCSFNKFQKFLTENPQRIVSQSNTDTFRGGMITKVINSSRRVFR